MVAATARRGLERHRNAARRAIVQPRRYADKRIEDDSASVVEIVKLRHSREVDIHVCDASPFSGLVRAPAGRNGAVIGAGDVACDSSILGVDSRHCSLPHRWNGSLIPSRASMIRVRLARLRSLALAPEAAGEARPSIPMGWMSLPLLAELVHLPASPRATCTDGAYLLHFIVLRPSLHGSRQERPPSLESSREDVYHGVAPLNCSATSMRLIGHGIPGGQRLLVFHGCWQREAAEFHGQRAETP